MRKSFSKYGFTITTVIVLVLVGVVFIYTLSFNALINKHQDKLIKAFKSELENRTGLQLDIESINAEFPFLVTLTNVTIDDDNSNRLLSSKEVVIKADWLRIVKKPREALSAVRYVELNEPVFSGKIRQGKLDWIELLARKPAQEKIPVRWEDVNLKVALNNGLMDLTYIKEKNNQVEKIPFALPFRLSGQVILAEGKVTLYPSFRFKWSEINSAGQAAGSGHAFPTSGDFLEIGGHGELDGDIKLWGKIDFSNFEQYYPVMKKLIKQLKENDIGIKPGSAKAKFEVKISNLLKGASNIIAELQLNLSNSVISTKMTGGSEITIKSGLLRYSFPSQNISFKCSGKIGNSNLDTDLYIEKGLMGNIKGNFKVMGFPLDFIPPDVLPAKLNPQGALDIQGWLGGAMNDIAVAGRISSDSIRIGNWNFRLDESPFVFNRGNLSFPQSQLTGYQSGTIDFAAFSSVGDKELTASIRARGLPFSFYENTVGFNLPFDVDGYPAVIASIIAKPKNFSSKIELNIDKGAIARILCTDIGASLSVLNREVNLDEVIFTPHMGGRCKAEGLVTMPDRLKLSFNLAEVKLANPSDSTRMGKSIKGTLFGQGNIDGTFSKPELTSSLRLYDAEIYGQRFGNARFDIKIDSTGLKESKAVLLSTGSSIELNAEYIFDNQRPMVLWGEWKNIPFSNLTKAQSKQNVLISGDGEFIGDADDLNGVIRIEIDGEDSLGNRVTTPTDQSFTGTFLDIDLGGIGEIKSFRDLINIFSGTDVKPFQDYYFKKGQLVVTGGLRFESMAQASETNTLMNILEADILPLMPDTGSMLREKKPSTGLNFPMDGLLAVDLSMEKKDGSWLISGLADGRDFKIRNEPLETLHADITTLENGNYNFVLNFSQGEGALAVKGQARWEEVIGSSPFDLDLMIDSYPIKSLSRLAGYESDSTFEGLMSGSGKVKGTPLSPSLHDINLSFKNAKLFGIPVEDNKLVFSWTGSRISIDQFEISGSDGFHALASGFIDLDPRKITDSRIDLRVDSLSLEKLQSGGFMPKGLTGSLSLITQIGYDPMTMGPKIYIDLSLENPSYHGIGMDRIAGQGIVDGATGEVKLGRMECRIGENSISVTGFIDLSKDQSLGKLNLRFLANKFDFNELLRKINIPINGEKATVDLDLGVKGTVLKPLINGTVSLAMTKPEFADIDVADEINLNFNVKNNRIDLTREDVSVIRNGSSISAFGVIDFGKFFGNGIESSRPKTPDENSFIINLVNDDNKPYPIDVFGVYAKVMFRGRNSDPGMRMSFNHGKILLSGVVDIIEGRYNISTIPQPGEKKIASPVELDLTVLFPQGFPIKSGNTIDINLNESRFQISGTPVYPSADGTLTVESGQLRLLDRTFNIEEAILQFKPFLGIDNPYLKGRATTIIVSQSIRNFAGTENIRVTAQIDARLRQLTSGVTFSSNRGTLTEDELMGIMMRQDLFQDFQEEGLLTTLSQQAFTIPGAFLSRFFETRGGFQNFQIGVDFEKDIFLNFEYEALPNWFFDFYYLLASDAELDIGLKYMFRRDSFVGVATDEQGSIILKFDYVIPIR